MLAGCAAPPPIGELEPRPAPRPVAAEPALPAAAQRLLELSRQAASPQREELLLRATTVLIEANLLPQAQAILRELEAAKLGPALLIRRQLLLAQIAEREQQPKQVLEHLAPLARLNVSDPQQAQQLHALRINAHEALGDRPAATEARLALAPLLGEGEAAQQNKRQVLHDVIALATQAAEQAERALLSGGVDEAFQAELAALETLFERVKQQYPEALIALRRAEPVIAREAITVPQRPRQVALLLPLSGQLGKAGEALRDGILGAFYAELGRAEQPILRIYDTGGDVETAWALYTQAVAEGAELVIGPLHKAAVSHFAQQPQLPVPTLALNYAADEATAPEALFQFGLSPEDEALQVAERAWQDGHRAAVVLVPETPWGERLATTFQRRWLELGGRIVETQRFTAEGNDFSQPIRRALQLDSSDARHRALGRLLGQGIEFTPRRRQDVDLVFIAAFPRQARLLRPQLKFHYAGELPVYSTSHAFSGRADARDDKDMDGITFGDMPWVLSPGSFSQQLREQIRTLWPHTEEGYWRLYALGIDAYRLIDYLSFTETPQSVSFNGETGQLWLDRQHRFHRQLRWARFQGGTPRLLD